MCSSNTAEAAILVNFAPSQNFTTAFYNNYSWKHAHRTRAAPFAGIFTLLTLLQVNTHLLVNTSCLPLTGLSLLAETHLIWMQLRSSAKPIYDFCGLRWLNVGFIDILCVQSIVKATEQCPIFANQCLSWSFYTLRSMLLKGCHTIASVTG